LQQNSIAEGHKLGNTAESILLPGIAAEFAGAPAPQLLLAGRPGFHHKNTADVVLALHADQLSLCPLTPLPQKPTSEGS
jgi:hypothetical protein